MNRFFISVRFPALILMTTALGFLFSQDLPCPSPKPNILVIVSDDQGYADAGFQGSRDILTPNLDRLAASGRRCTNGYVTDPMSSPSRAGLLTGRYQQRFGLENNLAFDPNCPTKGLPTSEKLLPEFLKEAGYVTGWIGKWHLGAAPEFSPQNRGFMETFGFLGGGHRYQNWKPNPKKEYFLPILRNGKPVEVTNHLTVALGNEAATFVKRHQKKPWFLYLAFNAPHTPHQPTAQRFAKFSSITDRKRRAYAAQISLMDDAIGETLAALKTSGQQNNTLIFFFSDNRGPVGQRGNGSMNTPLRDGKDSVYEGGIHVPFLVSWPGKIPQGHDYISPVSTLDIFPTALTLAGIPLPTDRPTDGVNLIPYLTGKNNNDPHETLFWRTAGGAKLALRQGDSKLVSLKNQPQELYDLSNDLGERRNLAQSKIEESINLTAKLQEWNRTILLSRNSPPTPPPKPNILVIVSDDQGYADAGFQGSKDILTPHLDRLAASGLRCTNGYVTHPFCSPSRAGLLTGRYQQRFGHEYNPQYLPESHVAGLPTSEKLLPQFLKEAEYFTGWIGKWHLGAAPEFSPQNRGFMETFGFTGSGHFYQNWTPNPKREYLLPILRNGQPETVTKHLTVALGNEAADFINRHSTEPWFLYLAFNAPHVPHQPTAERLEQFSYIADPKRKAYAAQISLMDDAIGETLDALSATGQENKTLIFFFSDNGGPVGQSGNGSDNTPLRDGKFSVYEGGVHVPFLVSWPGIIPQGCDYPMNVSTLDVFPTALTLAGVPLPTERPTDGVNLIPYLTGKNKKAPHETLFWRTEGGAKIALRNGDSKLVVLENEPEELYDLSNDLGESENLAPSCIERLNRLVTKLEEWNRTLIAPVFGGPSNNTDQP